MQHLLLVLLHLLVLLSLLLLLLLPLLLASSEVMMVRCNPRQNLHKQVHLIRPEPLRRRLHGAYYDRSSLICLLTMPSIFSVCFLSSGCWLLLHLYLHLHLLFSFCCLFCPSLFFPQRAASRAREHRGSVCVGICVGSGYVWYRARGHAL